MDRTPGLIRRWQRLFDMAAPDREIRVNSVGIVSKWPGSAVFTLNVDTEIGQTQLYAKQLTSTESVEVRVYRFASSEPGFPAPRAFVICAKQTNAQPVSLVSQGGPARPEEPIESPRENRLEGAWLVTETARGVRLAETATSEEWQRGAVLLAGFHEKAAVCAWTEKIAGLDDLRALPGLAQQVLHATRSRIAQGVYSGVDCVLLNLVSVEMLSGWPSRASLSRLAPN